MSKTNCNIIKDLLPSYMENICSNDTREFVENHLSECENCRKFADMMKKTELVSEKTDKEVIDYMKKVKRHILNKNIMSFGLLVLIVFGMAIVAVNYGDIPTMFYYIIMPILMLVSHLALSDCTANKKNTRWKIGMSTILILLIAYSIILEFICTQWGLEGKYLFGEMEASKIGPFFYHQLLLITIIQIIIFVAAIVRNMKTGISHESLMNGCVLGCCINLVFISLLKRLDTVESCMKIRNQTFCIVFIEGVLLMVLFSLLNKKEEKAASAPSQSDFHFIKNDRNMKSM